MPAPPAAGPKMGEKGAVQGRMRSWRDQRRCAQPMETPGSRGDTCAVPSPPCHAMCSSHGRVCVVVRPHLIRDGACNLQMQRNWLGMRAESRAP
jgi:hypothetical protein